MPPTWSCSTTSSSCSPSRRSRISCSPISRGTGPEQAALILLVVWWAWNYTTWVTNVLDPEAVPVRLLVLGIMFASLVMAVAIPGAFGDRALLFAGAYVAIQIGRHAFLTFVVAGRDSQEREPALHILIWFCAAGVLLAGRRIRRRPAPIGLWLVALAIDYSAPVVPLPGAGTSEARAHRVGCRDVALRRAVPAVRDHRARRVDRRHRRDDLAALARRRPARRVRRRLPHHRRVLVALLQLRGRDRAASARARRAERTTMARDGYTFLHVVLVAGVIVSAVGDEIVIAHPTDDVATGRARRGRRRPGHLSRRSRPLPSGDGRVAERKAGRRRRRLRRRRLLRARDSRRSPSRRCSSLVLVAIIVAEQLSGRRRRQRGEPSPMQQLESSAATAPSARPAG